MPARAPESPSYRQNLLRAGVLFIPDTRRNVPSLQHSWSCCVWLALCVGRPAGPRTRATGALLCLTYYMEEATSTGLPAATSTWARARAGAWASRATKAASVRSSARSALDAAAALNAAVLTMPAAPSTAPRAATARTRAEAAPSTATAVAAPRHDDDNGLREKLRPIFAKFDISGDGQVSVGELRGILSAANVKLSADEIRSVVMEADADSSGSLSFDEFYSALSKQLGDASKRGDLSGGLLRGGLLSIVHDTGGFLNFNFNPLQWLPSAIFTAPLPGAPPADEPSQPPPAPAPRLCPVRAAAAECV